MSKATLTKEALVSRYTAQVTTKETYAAVRTSIRSLVASGQCTQSDADDAIDELREVLVRLEAPKSGKGVVTIVARRLDTDYEDRSPGAAKGAMVKGKGNVCVYGIQRMPIALYPRQWESLLGKADDIRKVIETNRAQLSFDKAE